MNTALHELLATRTSTDPAEILQDLRNGLSTNPEESGPAQGLHELLQGFFAIEDVALDSSYGEAFRQHPAAARALLAAIEEEGEAAVARLVRSILDGRPDPSGALAEALGFSAQQGAGEDSRVSAALKGFASVALATPEMQVELELSLAWDAVEEILLDRVEHQQAVLAYAHSASRRKVTGRRKTAG